ncbi:hypothetical protein [Burkholderia vietnamiensis]|uniref:hypothetical protein n=1 Tax=Burkholderia vietnamiensis TaxID=60552 RepID=UPI001B9D143F|nr:hypothetical protein [Burkholderia vietnamiensis]MBR8201666.1 hypothetical protein [Burkholderia vietnamiensis]
MNEIMRTPFEKWLNREGCLLDAPTKDQCVDAQQRAFDGALPTHRQNTIDAINGAIAFGYQNVHVPAADHWLAQFWNIGRLQADLVIALEMIAAEDDAARERTKQPLLTSGVRTMLDAALIKAGRKAAPVREGE